MLVFGYTHCPDVCPTPPAELSQALQQRSPQWNQPYPAIRAEARAVEATLYYADESGIRTDYHTGATSNLVLKK